MFSNSNVKNLALLASAFLSFAGNTHAKQEYQNVELTQFLESFHQNPVKVMNQAPFKIKAAGAITPLSRPSIPEHEIENNWFLHEKDQIRKKICFFDEELKKEICATDLAGRAASRYNDDANTLTDLQSKNITTLKTMDKRELQRASLTTQPWSDDYWSISNGVLAYRYADPDKTYGEDWKEVTDYVRERESDLMIESGLVSLLSPAEKYDLLVGDKNYTLTQTMLNEGKTYYDRDGKVESWMGICHGWAPAAFMLPRPTKVVTVVAADGVTKIPFYPSDIKALGSLLWAKNSPYTRFSGGRCNAKDPKTDSENGRIIDQDCFDTNPGTWHKVVVNQIGVSDRSFVIDATFDYEVWNQPVQSYSYEYFNPQTFKRFNNFEDAQVKVEDFTKDKFKSYRSEEAKYIVGVEMRLNYVAETRPSHRSSDASFNDYVTTVIYRYDLELSGSSKIIGGEWYSNKHPDFLWTPLPDARSLTDLDKNIENLIQNQDRKDLIWKKGEAIPSQWSQNLKFYSRKGIPLGLVVEGLIERSND